MMQVNAVAQGFMTLKELKGHKSYFPWLIFLKSIKYFKALYVLTHRNYHESKSDMGGRVVP